MKRAVLIAAGFTSILAGGVAVWALAGGRPAACSNEASACAPSADEAAAGRAVASGKVLGRFDLTMAGCRFACATRQDYDPNAVLPQPAAREGRLTQCPVSGVVFTVDAERPHVQVGADDYVTCCDACSEKLRQDPGRFVRV